MLVVFLFKINVVGTSYVYWCLTIAGGHCILTSIQITVGSLLIYLHPDNKSICKVIEIAE